MKKEDPVNPEKVATTSKSDVEALHYHPLRPVVCVVLVMILDVYRQKLQRKRLFHGVKASGLTRNFCSVNFDWFECYVTQA